MDWSLVQVQPKDEAVPAPRAAGRCCHSFAAWLFQTALGFLFYDAAECQPPLLVKLASPLRLLLDDTVSGVSGSEDGVSWRLKEGCSCTVT